MLLPGCGCHCPLLGGFCNGPAVSMLCIEGRRAARVERGGSKYAVFHTGIRSDLYAPSVWHSFFPQISDSMTSNRMPSKEELSASQKPVQTAVLSPCALEPLATATGLETLSQAIEGRIARARSYGGKQLPLFRCFAPIRKLH